jgi:two-component system phosphate regulon sensor histidine kinase PhoR
MHLPRQRWLWFAAAIAVPCAALLYLGLRLLAQEDQIAQQRERESLQSRIDNLRRDLQTALEPLRLAPHQPAGVAFQGVVREGRAYLSWELQPAAAAVRKALLLDPAAAAPVSAPDAAGAFQTLQRAVTLDRAGQSAAAAAAFLRVAGLPAVATDDYAVPLALYAIPRVAPGRRPEMLRRCIESIVATPHVVSPTGLRMALSLAREQGLNAPLARLELRLENARAGEAFQASYAASGGASPARWQAFGELPYLIGYAPAPQPGEFIFRAVRAAEVAAGLAGRPRFSLQAGHVLGEPFPGLRVTLPESPHERAPWQRPFVLAVLALAFSMALTGGFLLWRDFRREAQLASLRTQFVAGVSHELRTPLTAIRMFTETLHDHPTLDEKTRQEYLATMLSENERLSRLVENVLEFSRIEGGRQSYHLRPVALAAVIRPVLASLQPLLDQNGFRLEVAIDEDLPPVQADPDALGQALANLLGNAMKYSGASREIRLEAARNGAHAAIRVIDHGFGIPAAEQQRIFASFYRARVPENNSIQGAGLGLTLVRHVMRGHQGQVQVESQPGRGSTFTLLLPVAREEAV